MGDVGTSQTLLGGEFASGCNCVVGGNRIGNALDADLPALLAPDLVSDMGVGLV
jgi:hypothetical protein